MSQQRLPFKKTSTTTRKRKSTASDDLSPPEEALQSIKPDEAPESLQSSISSTRTLTPAIDGDPVWKKYYKKPRTS